ncbi:MAG: hypothetical protein AAFO94_06145 [Bacteroidota bacterium]
MISVPFAAKLIIIFIIAGFMPITLISFFRVMIAKKEKNFNKALTEMGIQSSRKVRDTFSPSKFVLPVGFVSLICILAAAAMTFEGVFLQGSSNNSLLLTSAWYENGNIALVNQSMRVIAFAFLGGFIWSAWNIIRRMVNADISPNIYFSAGIRMILAVVIALVTSFLLGAESSTNFINLQSSLPAIALLTGMFPERVLQFLINTFKRYLGEIDLNEKELSLYNIEGISIQHKERLEEIGIDNAQNLATASLTQLLIDTPYQARQLLDWIGQAKLLCYAKNDIEKFRSVGIRSIFDLKKGEKSREALVEIADSLQLNTPVLQVIHNQIQDDEGISALYRFQQRLDSPTFDAISAAQEEQVPVMDMGGRM